MYMIIQNIVSLIICLVIKLYRNILIYDLAIYLNFYVLFNVILICCF